MRELKLVLLSVIITISTALLGVFFKENLWDIVQIIFLENILLLIIQIFLKQRDEDSDISDSLSKIRHDRQLWSEVANLFKAIAASKRHDHEFFAKQIHNFIGDATRTIESCNDGIFRIDLRPGGFFFREAEAPLSATTTFWATSYVNPNPYWRGAIGSRLLNKSKKKVTENVTVSRIFIEQSSNISSIADIVQSNIDAGVKTKVVEADTLDSRLRRDFAIVDGGALGVELILGENREPIEARYYSPETETGRKAIAELTTIWHQLTELAQ